MRTLAIEAPQSFPSLQAAARQLAATFAARQRWLRNPVPGQWVTLAARLAADLARDPARCLVHTDLHYDNILASEHPVNGGSRSTPQRRQEFPNVRRQSCCGPG